MKPLFGVLHQDQSMKVSLEGHEALIRSGDWTLHGSPRGVTKRFCDSCGVNEAVADISCETCRVPIPDFDTRHSRRQLLCESCVPPEVAVQVSLSGMAQ